MIELHKDQALRLLNSINQEGLSTAHKLAMAAVYVRLADLSEPDYVEEAPVDRSDHTGPRAGERVVVDGQRGTLQVCTECEDGLKFVPDFPEGKLTYEFEIDHAEISANPEGTESKITCKVCGDSVEGLTLSAANEWLKNHRHRVTLEDVTTAHVRAVRKGLYELYGFDEANTLERSRKLAFEVLRVCELPGDLSRDIVETTEYWLRELFNIDSNYKKALALSGIIVRATGKPVQSE